MDKWKVLIADDEFIIRDGIRSSVDWDKFDMEVVGEAEDGEEAIELALEHKVDILLIDLNMPIVNGINAMKEITNHLPNCQMVIITGYDDFRYAQEAIRLRVKDYLLKPVNPGKLQDLVLELKGKLESERNQESYLKQAANQIQKNHAQLKERFFQDWIKGKLASTEIVEQLTFLNLPTTLPIQYLVVRWPEYHQNQTHMQESDRQVFFFAIENIVEEILGSNNTAVFRDDSHLLNVCAWERVTSEQLIKLTEAVQNYLNINVFCHVEEIGNGELSELRKAYKLSKLQVDKQSKLSPVVKKVQSYIQDHYNDSSLTLGKVADEFHVSMEYLSRILKQELGISYVGLLTQMRINKAIDLLKTTDMTIREIAEEVGYDSQHYFSTAFKKTMGISPKQFKK
ncbi:response regulator transcription factor [Aquibacillus kalidii]|uniref:response regulator transcription factor n=1 Tax=Aquibacillus kalidii TaxID=2762597 RepID=UPI001645C4D3|nr:response regulator [Aquibacillus kalidii]